MKARCPECSATYEVPKATRPRRARCKCGATFLLAENASHAQPVLEQLDEPKSVRSILPASARPAAPRHNVKPTRVISVPAVVIGVAMILFGGLWGVLALSGGIALAADGAQGVESATAGFTAISLFFSGACILAGFGLIFSQPWGWWMATVFQVGGLLMIGRLLWSPLSSLNWDHPDAEGAFVSLSLVYGIPFLITLAIVMGLFLPSVRLACGVKSKPLPTRRRKVAGRPR